MAEAARRKYQSPAQTLATDNRFTAEAYQQFRAQERELEAWKRQEDAELQHDYEARLAEMRQEYHTKLVDIDKAYHEKERSLGVEQAKLERDLVQAKEQLSRSMKKLPRLELEKAKDIFSYKYEDFKIHDYDPHPAIRAEVSV